MEEELEQMGAPLAIQRQSRRLWQDWTAARSVLCNILSNTRPYQGLFQRLTIIGGYAVDFCAPQRRLVVEIDGDPADAAVAGDAERIAALEREGYRVLRFRSDQVLNQPLSVLRAIEQACDQRSPHAAQTPSPLLSQRNGSARRASRRADTLPLLSQCLGRGGPGRRGSHLGACLTRHS